MELGNTQACSPWSWKALYICSEIVLGSCLTPILWVILLKDALKMMLQLIGHCLSKKKTSTNYLPLMAGTRLTVQLTNSR
jgi:hypothetical protein